VCICTDSLYFDRLLLVLCLPPVLPRAVIVTNRCFSFLSVRDIEGLGQQVNSVRTDVHTMAIMTAFVFCLCGKVNQLINLTYLTSVPNGQFGSLKVPLALQLTDS
jgi:hypothetical protein